MKIIIIIIILDSKHHVNLGYFIHVREHTPGLPITDDLTVEENPGFFTTNFYPWISRITHSLLERLFPFKVELIAELFFRYI